MADRGIFGVALTGLNRAHDDLADVGADSDLEIPSFFRAQPLGEAAHLVLHSQSCVERELRMVLMRYRCAEQSKDAVAGGLHDETAVAVDGIHHQPERGIDQSSGLF